MTTQHSALHTEANLFAELFGHDRRGSDIPGNNLVLPGAIIDAMPPSWRARCAALVHEARCAYPQAPWPAYLVTAMTRQPLGMLSPDKLAEVGADLEVDDQARCHLVDRRTGTELAPDTEVWVSCPDPLLSTVRDHA